MDGNGIFGAVDVPDVFRYAKYFHRLKMAKNGGKWHHSKCFGTLDDMEVLIFQSSIPFEKWNVSIFKQSRMANSSEVCIVKKP